MESDLVARFKTEGQRRFVGDFRGATRGVKDFGQETAKASGRVRNAKGQFVSTGEAAEKAGRKAKRGAAGFASFSTRFGKLRGGFGIGGPIGLAASFIGVGAAVDSMASEFQESVKVGAQTSSVLKSTGRAAGITKRHVENLSDAISRKIAVDDEEIQSSANLLLTFKKIRNETGKGNKIFDRATMAVQDLSARMGVGARSSAIMLGKALQDPVKGLTALGRAGVSFSEKQKTMVKRMVETGNRLGAQRFLLREIESQVKGAAASQATPIDRLRVSWGNLAESMGKLGAPIVTKGINGLTGFLDRLQGGGGIEGRVNKIAGTVKRLIGLVSGAEQGPKQRRGPHPERTSRAAPAPKLSGFESFAKRSGEIFRSVKGAATEAGRTLVDAFAPAMPFLRNVLLPVVVGIGKGVVGSLVVGFRLLVPVLRVTAGAIKVVATVLGWVGKQAKPLRGWIDKLGIALGVVAHGPMLAMGAVARTASEALSKFVGFAKSIPSKLGGLGGKIVGGIADGIKAAPGALLDAFKSVLGTLLDGLPFGVGGILKKRFGLDGKAAGGRARYTGPHVVGEKGPEVVNLNRGDHVTPNARLGRAAGALAGGAAFLTVPIVVELDGRQVGRGVGRIALNDLARA